MTKVLSIVFSLIFTFLGSFAGDTAKLFASGIDTVTNVNKPLSVNENETNLSDTVKYAASLKNSVQGVFTDTDRNAFRLSNSEITFTHGLKNNLTATLKDIDGKTFIRNSFKTFYTDKAGFRHYFEKNTGKGRVNIIRLGEYYYDAHIRDLAGGNFKVDKNYHVYGDRLYGQYSLYAKKATDRFTSFGMEVAVPKSKVEKYEINKEKGYAAFVIRNVGVVGFIIGDSETTDNIFIDETAGKYIFTQTAKIGDGRLPAYDNENITEDNLPRITFGSRIYTDSTDSFDSIKAAAFEERNPLTDITVGGNNANCKYLGYDALRGAYTFTNDGTDFNIYYRNPGFQYNMPITFKGDGVDRKINIRFFGKNGCLEAGAVLDDQNRLVPIDVEVCKNFQGDGGESFYSPKDFQYGDSFIPLSVKKNGETKFTMLHLYNGWGKNQLKQLSSIEFHVSYYHLSTGCTESNCIAPYSVSNTVNDGWLLPDFRCRSGNIWSGQPQFNSVGVLKFMVDKGRYGEFSGSQISSCGQTFADVTDYYTADSGKYTYSLRHAEFPSNDENRTFYSINVTFNEDVTFSNFKKNFSLFSFNGRFNAFSKLGYLNSENEATNISAITGGKDKYYTLGTDKPYYSFYDVTPETVDQLDKAFGCNFSYIVLDSSIISQGKKADIPFAVRVNGTSTQTQGDLTLDTKKIAFKKGDSISMNVILLPNGVGTEKTDDHTVAVRNEERLSVNAVLGTVTDDTIIPSVKAVDNKAKFTVRGGMNMTTVRVDNITTMTKPEIFMNKGGVVSELDNSLHGYDGYSITPNSDGTYSISFVYNSDGSPVEFTVNAK